MGHYTPSSHLNSTSEMSGGSKVPVTMRDFFFDDPFFKNSWEDFDRVKDAMFTESRDMWKKFDEDFRNMACMSNNIMLESSAATEKAEAPSDPPRSLMRQDSKSRWESGWMFPRRWMLPALNTDFPQQHGALQHEGQRGDQGEGGRQQAGGQPGHQPVQTGRAQGRREYGVLVVEGKHEEKAEDGSKMVS